MIIAADQVTKTWALDHLGDGPRHIVGPIYLRLDLNPGTAFSLGAGVTPVIEAAVIVLVVALVLFASRASRTASVPIVIGLGLLLGGALGNLGDRLFRHHHGAVVDFIQAVSWWPIFNVADSAIVVGVIIMAISYWLSA